MEVAKSRIMVEESQTSHMVQWCHESKPSNLRDQSLTNRTLGFSNTGVGCDKQHYTFTTQCNRHHTIETVLTETIMKQVVYYSSNKHFSLENHKRPLTLDIRYHSQTVKLICVFSRI